MKTNSFDPIIKVCDDGHFIPEVRAWSEQKYKLAGGYADIFTKGMRYKWKQLIYIDLFAGAGYSKIKGTNKILLSSPLIAMSIPTKFDKYILCEEDPERFEALQSRVKRDFSHLNVELIKGDSNQNIQEICKRIPPYSKECSVLSYSFVDPFSLNLHYATIKELGKTLMDFLILMALNMDAARNLDTYLNTNSLKIEQFIGNYNWREDFLKGGNTSPNSFIKFLADHYERNMIQIGYKKPTEFHQIRSDDRNLPLYYLAFYSKHDRGNDFWNKTKKFANPQSTLDF